MCTAGMTSPGYLWGRVGGGGGWRNLHLRTRLGVDGRKGQLADTFLMTLTDYILDLALIGIVLLQVRGRRLSSRWLITPLVIVGWAASQYLTAVPTAGNDVVLIAGCALAGGLLGGLCALFTKMTTGNDGVPIAKAGWVAAALWVLGVGARFAFQLYATHGGGASIAHFSTSHHITMAAWVDALLLMAIAEAVLRTAILASRGYALRYKAGRRPATQATVGNTWSMMVPGERPF